MDEPNILYIENITWMVHVSTSKKKKSPAIVINKTTEFWQLHVYYRRERACVVGVWSNV